MRKIAATNGFTIYRTLVGSYAAYNDHIEGWQRATFKAKQLGDVLQAVGRVSSEEV